jgi:succinate dehydrogenase / fumarate reductase cytochrome b subunit
MFRLLHFLRSGLGAKLVMAVTGLALVLFVVVHMLGNLTIYQGPAAIAAYTDWLQGHPFLWVARVGLLAVAVLHVWLGLRLAARNRRARPARYAVHRSLAATPAGRTMAWTGLLVLAFLGYHLLHLTFRVTGPQPEGDIYARVVAGFSDPWVAALYGGAVAALALHLHHAAQSLFQTLGIGERTHRPWLRALSPAVAVVVGAGFASIPAAVQLGLLGLAGGTR